MIKLELLLDKDKVDEVKKLLREIGIKKISFIDIKEYDEENIHVEGYRGATYIVDCVEKTKVEVLLDSQSKIDRALDMISVADINAEVLVYEVMKSFNLHKRVDKKSSFSFGDGYRKEME